jgi:NADPH:quinone reductase
MNDRYRALVCTRLSPDLSGLALQTLDAAPPAAGEVSIRVRAAALNFPDLLMSQGAYQHKPALPFVLGLEGAGEVLALGTGVKSLSVGDPVCFGGRSGAIAERIVLPASDVRPMPRRFDFRQGAAYRVGALTAYVALVRRAQLQAGETLLVHGASGGMGMAAVQLGVHLGATVIATASSQQKLDAIRAAGAHHAISSRTGFGAQVKALTAGAGADVVFDPVGGDVFDESLRAIGWGGRLLVVGFASGRIPTVDINLPLIKGFAVIGVRAGEYGRRNPQKGAENQAEIERLAEAGAMTPHIGAVFDLAHAIDALGMLAARQAIGKIVIEL